jgi:hypothetical protein
MPTYRARSCPNCNFYVGLTITRPSGARSEAPVNGLCLNCGYQIPVHAVVAGKKKAPPGPKQRWSPISVALGAPRKLMARRESQEKLALETAASRSRPYGVDLRAIGQELERLQHNHFNIECRGASYWVWPRNEGSERLGGVSSAQNDGRLKDFLRRSGFFSHKIPYRYDPADIDRIDQKGKAKRQPDTTTTDGHRMSQLLRTLGTLVSRRGQGLLAISWQDASISVVVESPRGERALNVYRRDNLYDSWVKCYLHRAGRAYSDVPT